MNKNQKIIKIRNILIIKKKKKNLKLLVIQKYIISNNKKFIQNNKLKQFYKTIQNIKNVSDKLLI